MHNWFLESICDSPARLGGVILSVTQLRKQLPWTPYPCYYLLSAAAIGSDLKKYRE